jgi:hypothetical protein
MTKSFVLPATMLVVTAMCTCAKADDIYGNRVATPTRLFGRWEIVRIVEWSERYGMKDIPIESSNVLNLRFSHNTFEILENNNKTEARDFYVAPPRVEYIDTQPFFYETGSGDSVFRKVDAHLERIEVLVGERLLEFDALYFKVSSQDSLFPATFIPKKPQLTRHIYFKKIREDITDRILPKDNAEEIFPEEVSGRWVANSISLTLVDTQSLLGSEQSATFSTTLGSRRRAYEYVPTGASGAMFLPLDGKEDCFTRLKTTYSPENNTLKVELVPEVRRWLKDILPALSEKTTSFVFQRAQ